MMRSVSTLMACLFLLAACGKSPPPKTTLEPSDAQPRAVDQTGGFGSENTLGQLNAEGVGVVTKDTYLVQRQTDRMNYARTLDENPSQGDLDTFEKRLSNGKGTFEVKAGTEVHLRGTATVKLSSGLLLRFTRVEIKDGSMTDDDGFPLRGSILEKHIEKTK